MNENKLIRIVLFILFLGLFFVYVVFFNIKKQKEITTETSSNTPIVLDNSIKKLSGELKDTKKSNGLLDNVGSGMVNNITNKTGLLNLTGRKNIVDTKTGEDLIPLPGFVNNDSDQGIINTDVPQLPNLSGTEPFFGEIEVTKTLGLDYKYILKDNDGIYYVYMGTGTYDYEKNTKLLGGDIFYLRTELDLLKNNLPGNLVMFVNIPNITYIKSPKFKRQLVFLVIYFDKNQRILQIPYEIYYKKKKHIKKIFDELY